MTPTPTPGFNNASASVVNAFGSTEGLVGPLLFIVWTVLIVMLLSAVRSSYYVEYVIDALGFVAESVYYFIHGLAALVGVSLVLAPGYYLATADASTQQTVGKYVVGAVVGYVVIAGVGYVVKHRFTDPARENLGEVLPDPEPEGSSDD